MSDPNPFSSFKADRTKALDVEFGKYDQLVQSVLTQLKESHFHDKRVVTTPDDHRWEIASKRLVYCLITLVLDPNNRAKAFRCSVWMSGYDFDGFTKYRPDDLFSHNTFGSKCSLDIESLTKALLSSLT